MIRDIRKWWINKRILAAMWDRRFYKRQMAAAFDEIQAAEERERRLRIKLSEVDHPLPRILRSRAGT